MGGSPAGARRASLGGGVDADLGGGAVGLDLVDPRSRRSVRSSTPSIRRSSLRSVRLVRFLT